MSERWVVEWDGVDWRARTTGCEGYEKCTCQPFRTWRDAFEYADRMARR